MNLIGKLRKPDPKEEEISGLIEKAKNEESIINVVYFLNEAVDLYKKLTEDRGKNYRKDLLYEIKVTREKFFQYEI